MIEFKITAQTASEFLAELTKAAQQMTAPLVVVQPDAPVLAQAAQDQVIKEPVRKPRAGKADTPTAVAVESKAADTPVTSDTAPAQPEQQPEKPSETPAPTTDSGDTAESVTEKPAGAVLDFDKDVAPLVLGYVKSHGKPWVMDVLSEFGVARASELVPERFGELVAALNDKAAA